MPTAEDFKRVIESEPELCADGLGVGGHRPKGDFDKLRAELFERFDDFKAAHDWLAVQKQRETVNRSRNSLSIKHDVGPQCRHGAFIAAVLYLGIPYSRCNDQPYCIFLAIADKGPR